MTTGDRTEGGEEGEGGGEGKSDDGQTNRIVDLPPSVEGVE